MRIAIAGATGRIGRLVAGRLERAGHEVVPISRGHGIDLATGAGLDSALAGVASVVDVVNAPAGDEASAVEFFEGTTRRLLAAEAAAGVRHHVLLSIVGIHGIGGNAHYAGKRAQEAAVEAGPVPYTIVPATQFHDFAAMVASWTLADQVAPIAPLLVQPIAPDDVAAVLAEVAIGPSLGRHREIAGPEPEDLVDMARRTLAARGESVRLRPTWRNGVFGPTMAGEVLLPGPDAQLAPTSFEAWLESEALNE